MGISRRTVVVGAWVTSLAVVGSMGVAWSDIANHADESAEPETISACVRVTNEDMRLETPEKPCKTDAARLSREDRVTWNVQGLPGRDGLDGADGAPGPKGDTGEKGDPGPLHTRTVTGVGTVSDDRPERVQALITDLNGWAISADCSGVREQGDGLVIFRPADQAGDLQMVSKPDRNVGYNPGWAALSFDDDAPHDTITAQFVDYSGGEGLTVTASRQRREGNRCGIVLTASVTP